MKLETFKGIPNALDFLPYAEAYYINVMGYPPVTANGPSVEASNHVLWEKSKYSNLKYPYQPFVLFDLHQIVIKHSIKNKPYQVAYKPNLYHADFPKETQLSKKISNQTHQRF